MKGPETLLLTLALRFCNDLSVVAISAVLVFVLVAREKYHALLATVESAFQPIATGVKLTLNATLRNPPKKPFSES